MSTVKREELIGNILKNVKIRFDYSNVFGLSADVLREISDTLFKHEFNKTRYSKMKEDDFLNLDCVLAENSVPLEYLKDLDSYSFMSADSGIVINVNQLFCEISHDANVTKYDKFENLFSKIKPVVNILTEKLNINIIRIGVTKIDEVFFENFDDFSKYFTEEALDFCIWNNEYIAESKLKQSFSIQNININLIKLLDKGILHGKEMFRLCLVYDVYSTDHIWMNQNIDEAVYEINYKTFELFEKIMTAKTIESLKLGERIGDDFNE